MASHEEEIGRQESLLEQKGATMIYEIGESAGKVWQFLSEHAGSTPEHIGKGVKLKESLLYAAIGWLAREGKLSFEGHDKTTKISLSAE